MHHICQKQMCSEARFKVLYPQADAVRTTLKSQQQGFVDGSV